MKIFIIGAKPSCQAELEAIYAHDEMDFIETVEEYRAIVAGQRTQEKPSKACGVPMPVAEDPLKKRRSKGERKRNKRDRWS